MSPRARRLLPLLLLVAAAWAGMQLFGGWRSEHLARDLVLAARAGDIVMLSSETCPYCDQARRWLGSRGVAFDECFIERDAACAQAYRALQAPGTPTFVVRGERIVGFDIERIARALGAGA